MYHQCSLSFHLVHMLLGFLSTFFTR
jgi:hypothetical protein